MNGLSSFQTSMKLSRAFLSLSLVFFFHAGQRLRTKQLEGRLARQFYKFDSLFQTFSIPMLYLLFAFLLKFSVTLLHCIPFFSITPFFLLSTYSPEIITKKTYKIVKLFTFRDPVPEIGVYPTYTVQNSMSM